MKNRKFILLAALLIGLCIIFAIFHMSSRDTVAENCVQLQLDGKTLEVSLDDLSYETISGIRINGKGEEIPVEAPGIAMKALLEQYNAADFEKVTVVSDDSYSAVVTAEEVLTTDNVNLLLEEGRLRLIVFGDSNSKRSVSNLAQIIVE